MPNRQARRGIGKHRGTRAEGRWDRIAESRIGDSRSRESARDHKAQEPWWPTQVFRLRKRDKFVTEINWDKVEPEKFDPTPRFSGAFRCGLCHIFFEPPFERANEAHKNDCPRRAAPRYCGICEQPLPTTASLSMKFHPGACREEGHRQMLSRMRLSVLRWEPERLSAFLGALKIARFATDAGAAQGLTYGTTRAYVSALRAHDATVPLRLVWFPRKARATPPSERGWPYVLDTMDRDNILPGLVAQYLDAAGSRLPHELRADVGQELLLDILEGRLSVDQLKRACEAKVGAVIRRVRQATSPWRERYVESWTRTDISGSWLDQGPKRMRDRPADARTGHECPICLKPVWITADHEICAVILEDRRRGRNTGNLGWHYMKEARDLDHSERR